jgi:hypothetical protein
MAGREEHIGESAAHAARFRAVPVYRGVRQRVASDGVVTLRATRSTGIAGLSALRR